MAEKARIDALLDKGAKLYGAGHTAAAAGIYREALALAPDDPTVRLRHATAIWHGENRAEEALAEVRDLAAKHPQALLFATEGLILNSLGRFADGAAAARKALDHDSGHSSAWLSLATALPADEVGPAITALETALAQPDLTDLQQREMHFAMAELLTKDGAVDAAFEHTERANALSTCRWTLEREAAFQAELQAVFTPEVMTQMRGQGHPDGRMIFILGMPRSGTTLLERMLMAHPDIGSVGETTTAGQLYNRLRAQTGDTPGMIRTALNPQNLMAMGSAYLTDINARLGADRPYRVIDKMPANYLFAPLIAMMLPRAQIIHMQRHPLDTGLSCYEANFAFGLDYASRLDLLGHAYRIYADLMDHWQTLPVPRIHSVRYERLVAAPEAELRALLDHCGLDWDPACLAPAEHGVIKTASVAQARTAVNTRSVGRWRAYKDRLAPMIEAMGGEDWAEARAAMP